MSFSCSRNQCEMLYYIQSSRLLSLLSATKSSVPSSLLLSLLPESELINGNTLTFLEHLLCASLFARSPCLTGAPREVQRLLLGNSLEQRKPEQGKGPRIIVRTSALTDRWATYNQAQSLRLPKKGKSCMFPILFHSGL